MNRLATKCLGRRVLHSTIFELVENYKEWSWWDEFHDFGQYGLWGRTYGHITRVPRFIFWYARLCLAKTWCVWFGHDWVNCSDHGPDTGTESVICLRCDELWTEVYY